MLKSKTLPDGRIKSFFQQYFSMGKEGIALHPETAPGYARIKKSVAGGLEELRVLSEKREWGESDRRQAAALLNAVARRAFNAFKRDIARKFDPVDLQKKNAGRSIENVEKTVERFKSEYGHVPPVIEDSTGEIEVNCAANSILLTMLFSELGGDKTGVFDTRTHIIPAVKLGGTTYVLDYHNHVLPRALTFREYIQALARDYRLKGRKMRGIARDVAKEFGLKKTGVTPASLAPAFRYYGGASTSRAVAHYNLGVTFDLLGDRERAEMQYLRAIEINPYAADAMHELGDIHEKRGNLEEAENWFRRSLQIQPNAVETQKRLKKLLTKKLLFASQRP